MRKQWSGNASYTAAPQVQQTFAVAAAPIVTTTAPNSITATGATFTGTVSARGASIAVAFDYGKTTAYGNSATALQSPVAANASGTVTTPVVTGLSCNSAYHYRINASSIGGNAIGTDQIFNTSLCPGTVPGSPTIVSATPGSGRATVAFTAPGNNGGNTISSYAVTCTANSQAPRHASRPGSPISVPSLKGGVAYSCSVVATNGVGNSAPSASLPVTPLPKTNTGMTPILMLLLD